MDLARNLQNFGGIPKVAVEVDGVFIEKGDAFLTEQGFHDAGTEVGFAAELSEPVYDAVAGQLGTVGFEGEVEGVADHARAAADAEVTGDGAVGGDASVRDARDDCIDAVVKIGFIGLRGHGGGQGVRRRFRG